MAKDRAILAKCSCVKFSSHRPGPSVSLPLQPLGWRPAYVPRDTQASSVNSVLWDTREKYLMGVPMPTAFPAPATSMAPVTPTQGSACVATTPRVHPVSGACQVSTVTPSQAVLMIASPVRALANQPVQPSQRVEMWCAHTALLVREDDDARAAKMAFLGIL